MTSLLARLKRPACVPFETLLGYNTATPSLSQIFQPAVLQSMIYIFLRSFYSHLVYCKRTISKSPKADFRNVRHSGRHGECGAWKGIYAAKTVEEGAQ